MNEEGTQLLEPPPGRVIPASPRVLVLNRVWQPVNIVGVRRAVGLLCQGHADVIDPYEGSYRVMNAEEWIGYSMEDPPGETEWVIRSVRLALRVPLILLLRYYERVPVEEVRLSRKAIFERDGYRCQYCGRPFPERELSIDHVIPRHFGGRTTWENLVTSCKTCNSRKANRLPHEAGFRLRGKPFRPRARPLICRLTEQNTEEAWRPFISKMA